MARSAFFRFAATFVLAYAGLSALFLMAGPAYARCVLPLTSLAVDVAHPDWMNTAMGMLERDGREVVVFSADIPAGTVFQGGVVRQRVKSAGATIDPALLYVQPVVVLSLIAAWPWLPPGRKLRAAALAVPGILLVSALDAMLRLTDIVSQGVDTGSLGAALRGYADYFMGNGGRQFVAVLVFMAAVAPFHLRSGHSVIKK